MTGIECLERIPKMDEDEMPSLAGVQEEGEENEIQEPQFESVAFKCIDRAISKLGRVGREVVYSYLARSRRMTPEQMLERPWELAKAFQVMFGPAYPSLERSMVQEIQNGFFMETEAGSIEEAVVLAKLKTVEWR
jgi:hypothetical protein